MDESCDRAFDLSHRSTVGQGARLFGSSSRSAPARLNASLCLCVPLEEFNEGCGDAPSRARFSGGRVTGFVRLRTRRCCVGMWGGVALVGTSVLTLRMESLGTSGMF